MTQRERALLEACQQFIPKSIALGNENVPDDLVIPLDVTMGELRRLDAACANASSPAAEGHGPLIEVERDSEGHVLICTGCGTVETVASIRQRCATAFTCCPERKMLRAIPSADSTAQAEPVAQIVMFGSDLKEVAWRKGKMPPAGTPVANKHYRPDAEFYVHAWNRGFHPQGDPTEKLRVSRISPPRGEARFRHPTTKPDDLMAKIMANVAGDTVCDPFMGTGSTGVAAIRAGKRFVGIERNPTYFETAAARIRAAVDSRKIERMEA